MLNGPSGSRRDFSQSGTNRWSLVRAIVLGVLLAVTISAILLAEFLPANQVILNAGDVSSENILAPFDKTYESEIRTQQARDAQAASVPDIYDPPDVSIARQQEVRARQIMDYISTVREDSYASQQQKTDWLSAIPDVELSPEVIAQILTLSEEDWQEVRDETLRVLILAMQGEIKEGQLASVRRSLPTLISYRLTDDQSDVVEVLAGGLVRANTYYNAARTEEARQQARDQVPPVTVTIRQGEALVRAGDRVQQVNIEALEVFGLHQQETSWQAIAGTVIFSVIAALLLGMLISRLHPTLWTQGRASIVTFLLIIAFVALAKLMLPGGGILSYLYPLPALTMLLTVFFGPALGIAVGVGVGLIAAFVTRGSLEVTIYVLAGSLMGVLALGQGERLRAFLRAGLAVALTNAAVIILFGLLAPRQDLLKVAINALVGLVMGGLAASLTLAAFFALSSLLDLITPFQLMDLARPTHPLFRQLLLKAPGTYHHTLLVGNMAEEAAQRIGADGLLTRVGTYYHDIGKTARPFFFTENRVGGVNPHDRLDPRTSARIIISHVTDGLEMAAKYKLPSAIRAFIPEHHGTGLTLAFYRMAVNADDEDGESVNKDDFRYPGPKPQSRETAIVMLADSCEARVRSAEPGSADEIDRLIRETIKARVDSGQLDESNLTLRDLDEIQTAFFHVLKGMFHPRVKYPEPVKVKEADGREIEV